MAPAAPVTTTGAAVFLRGTAFATDKGMEQLPRAVKLGIRLPPALLARLKDEVGQKRVKASEIVRRALAAYLGDPALAEVNPVGNPHLKAAPNSDGRKSTTPLSS